MKTIILSPVSRLRNSFGNSCYWEKFAGRSVESSTFSRRRSRHSFLREQSAFWNKSHLGALRGRRVGRFNSFWRRYRETRSGGLCRLKLSIIDTEFNYLIVSPEVHACVSYLREAATDWSMPSNWTIAPAASIKREPAYRKPSLATPNCFIKIYRRLNLICNNSIIQWKMCSISWCILYNDR